MIAQLISLAVVALLFLSAPIWPRRTAQVTTTTTVATTTTSVTTTTLPTTTTTTLPPASPPQHSNSFELNSVLCQSADEIGWNADGNANVTRQQSPNCNFTGWSPEGTESAFLDEVSNARDQLNVRWVVQAPTTSFGYRFKHVINRTISSSNTYFAGWIVNNGLVDQNWGIRHEPGTALALECNTVVSPLTASLTPGTEYIIDVDIDTAAGDGTLRLYNSTGGLISTVSCDGAADSKLFNGYNFQAQFAHDEEGYYVDCVEWYTALPAPAPTSACNLGGPDGT